MIWLKPTEFYNRFNLANDFRTKTWLTGPQYYPDGNGGFTNQPAYFTGTTTQIVITPQLVLVPGKPMDVGNTIASQCEGIRSIKYYPDPAIIQVVRHVVLAEEGAVAAVVAAAGIKLNGETITEKRS